MDGEEHESRTNQSADERFKNPHCPVDLSFSTVIERGSRLGVFWATMAKGQQEETWGPPFPALLLLSRIQSFGHLQKSMPMVLGPVWIRSTDGKKGVENRISRPLMRVVPLPKSVDLGSKATTKKLYGYTSNNSLHRNRYGGQLDHLDTKYLLPSPRIFKLTCPHMWKGGRNLEV